MKYLLIFFVLSLSLFAYKKPLTFGDDAPEFRLPDQEGFTHSLIQHRGQFVFLFFYPRDFSFYGGKTVSSFEKAYKALKDRNVIIYGVSQDFQKTHLLFHEKFKLTYDLLSDPEEEVIRQYQATGFLGKKYISYLIGPDGRIFKKYEHQSPMIHPSLALEDLKKL